MTPSTHPQPAGDYPARLDGVGGRLWEPLWQLAVELRPVERALLTCPALRRLHFIHHAGPAYLVTPHAYSRLQHTLGVFATVAFFRPDDDLLRAAALLHDVGHAPFSHALEALAEIDHHAWTVARISQDPVAAILRRHGLEPVAVLAAIRGEPANLLRNRDNVLHLDHLDSWVRSALAGGILPVPAPRILARLRAEGPYLDTDLATAELLTSLITAEAHFHASPANVGANTVLAHLVRQALTAGAVSLERLAGMTDTMLEQVLFETAATRAEAERLWSRPDQLIVTRAAGDSLPPGAYPARLERLYLAPPRTGGRPVDEVSPRAARWLVEAGQLAGTYLVQWAGAEEFIPPA